MKFSETFRDTLMRIGVWVLIIVIGSGAYFGVKYVYGKIREIGRIRKIEAGGGSFEEQLEYLARVDYKVLTGRKAPASWSYEKVEDKLKKEEWKRGISRSFSTLRENYKRAFGKEAPADWGRAKLRGEMGTLYENLCKEYKKTFGEEPPEDFDWVFISKVLAEHKKEEAGEP